MPEQSFKPGEKSFLSCDSRIHPYGAVFEDDAETGNFYPLDLTRSRNMVLDSVHIYNAADVSDRDRSSVASIVWSTDGSKCALLINGYAHAAFDFGLRRGYCRTNFPNCPNSTTDAWDCSDHEWRDDVVGWVGN